MPYMKLTTLILLAATALGAAEGGFHQDFNGEGDPGLILAHPKEDTTTIMSLATAPEARGRSLHLTWTAAHGPWVVAMPKTGQPVPGLDGDGFRGEATVAVLCPDPKTLNAIGLQLIDSRGETFQWKQPASKLQAGTWTTLTFALAPTGFADSWGAGKTGKPTPPMLFKGLAFDFKAPAAGEIWFDDLAIKPLGN
jgi:hypothetical protein